MTDRPKPPPPPILATFDTPTENRAEVYELDEDGKLRAVRSAAVDKPKPAGRVSMGFSAEELKPREGMGPDERS